MRCDVNKFLLRFPENPDLTEEGWWQRLRTYRNELLAQSDWTILPDSPVDKTAWATYRQALRDLPSTVADPSKVIFPEAPQG